MSSHPDGLPMHAKFLLIDADGRTAAWLGSYNFNEKSRLRNAEVLLRTSDMAIVEALTRRFDQIAPWPGPKSIGTGLAKSR